MTDYSDTFLKDILSRSKVIAVVGISANTARPSHRVARFLQSIGKRIVPVNPGLEGQSLLGEPVYASLGQIPADVGVDMVDVFRKSEDVPPVVQDALDHLPGLKTIWLQLGIVNDTAAAQAQAAGIDVVQNRCPAIEHPRLFG